MSVYKDDDIYRIEEKMRLNSDFPKHASTKPTHFDPEIAKAITASAQALSASLINMNASLSGSIMADRQKTKPKLMASFEIQEDKMELLDSETCLRMFQNRVLYIERGVEISFTEYKVRSWCNQNATDIWCLADKGRSVLFRSKEDQTLFLLSQI